MIDPKKCQGAIDDLAKKLSEALPDSLKNAKAEMEKTFHSILQTAFAKLDLVTREEFDVQAAVLGKTRSKLDALEITVRELELRANIPKFDTDNRDND